MSTPTTIALQFDPFGVLLIVDGKDFTLDDLRARGLVTMMDTILVFQIGAKLESIATKAVKS
jgi:hypothetical protein